MCTRMALVPNREAPKGNANTPLQRLIGRENETRRLQTAWRQRQSQLIWGDVDAGKTYLIAKTLAELPEIERRKCICCTGRSGRRQLVEQLIRGLYLAGDPIVREKVHSDRFSEASLVRWISEQSALRLRGILFTASEKGEYRFVLDHLEPVSHTVARLLKDIIYRTKTPVYLTGHGYSSAEIGYAWSLYWTDEYRIRLGPLSEAAAHELVEICVRDFGLTYLDLTGFPEEVLRLSRRLPGSIVKMCQMATDPRYHYGEHVKVKLVHVDYLLRGNRFSGFASHSS